MIGYYAHHVGIGHVNRVLAIATRSATRAIGFSTNTIPADWPGRWIELPDDSADVDPEASDVTAHGTLHWVPRRNKGLRDRMCLIGNELARGEIQLMVVDVSIEVALLSRLFGVPVVVVALPGDRSDRAHRQVYDMADRLFAPWPAIVKSEWPRTWLEKTEHLGAVSRFDHHSATPPPASREVVVLWGSGGLDVSADDIRATAAATPDWHWNVLGPIVGDDLSNLTWQGWADDVWSALGSADVVVTHAGQNALAEVAAARRPAVVVPQDRPHNEQRATAAALRDLGICVVANSWPPPAEWPSLLTRALSKGGASWERWSSGDGARRAASVLDALATQG